MLSLQRCRELLAGDARSVSDEELEAVRKQFYALALVGTREAIQAQRFEQAIAKLREEERADVEERAAIMQFDGRLSREQAERLALSPYTRKLPRT